MAEGFGSDMWCDESGLQTSRLVRADLAYVQAMRRRFATEPQTLQGVDDDDERPLTYGFDLAALIGQIGYDASVAAIPNIVRAQALLDDRTADALVTATKEKRGDGTIFLRVHAEFTPHDSAESFPLTLEIDNVSVQVLTQ